MADAGFRPAHTDHTTPGRLAANPGRGVCLWITPFSFSGHVAAAL